MFWPKSSEETLHLGEPVKNNAWTASEKRGGDGDDDEGKGKGKEIEN